MATVVSEAPGAQARGGLSARPVSARTAGWSAAALLLAAALAALAYDYQVDFGAFAFGAGAAQPFAVLSIVPGPILTAAGVLAHWSRPRSRIGLLLVAEGIVFNASALAFSTTYVPAAAELSTVTAYLGLGIGVHVLLSYPSGRLRARRDRILACSVYLAAAPASRSPTCSTPRAERAAGSARPTAF